MQINVPGKNTIYVGAQQHFVFTFSRLVLYIDKIYLKL